MFFRKEFFSVHFFRKQIFLGTLFRKFSFHENSTLRYECDETFSDECEFAARAEGE